MTGKPRHAINIFAGVAGLLIIGVTVHLLVQWFGFLWNLSGFLKGLRDFLLGPIMIAGGVFSLLFYKRYKGLALLGLSLVFLSLAFLLKGAFHGELNLGLFLFGVLFSALFVVVLLPPSGLSLFEKPPVKPVEQRNPMRRRPTKDQYYLDIAQEVCRRGTCRRRNYGAVIVKDDQIVSTGYTGAPRGAPNCIDLKTCPRQENGVPPGERYELCRSVHAEMNAVIHASRQKTQGATLYLAGIEAATGHPVAKPEPCLLCRRVIINAGIARVVVRSPDGRITSWNPKTWISDGKV